MFTSWLQTVFHLHQENLLDWNSLCFPLFFLSSLPLSHFYILCVCVSSVVSDSLRPHGPWPTCLLCAWDFPGKKTGAGSLPSSKGYSRPRDQTHISCMFCIRRIPYHCATWKAPWTFHLLYQNTHKINLILKNISNIWRQTSYLLGSLVGCGLCGRTESDMTEAT